MTPASEWAFYQAVKKVAVEHNLTEGQQSMVEMYCAENGSDCGADCWTVAISTLEMIIDQGTLKSRDVCGHYADKE